MKLERRSVKFIDCRRSGFSASEPVAKLRQFHKQWKSPFQTDYNQDSQFRPYEQLMCLRQDLEEALGIASGFSRASVHFYSFRETDRRRQARRKTSSDFCPVTASKDAIPALEEKVSNLAPADVESFEEKIWEQLIATPPFRGRSMTTVTVQDTRVLLSAWKLRRSLALPDRIRMICGKVIVARALLSVAIERRKKIIDFKTLQQAPWSCAWRDPSLSGAHRPAEAT